MKHIDEYIKYLESLNFRVSTLNQRKTAVEQFDQWINCKGEQQITYQNVRDYFYHLQKQSIHINTINIKIKSLQKYFEYLVKRGNILINPAENIVLPRHHPFKRREILTVDEISQVMRIEKEASEQEMRDSAILHVLYCAALRVGELINLNVTDLHLKENELYIRNTKTKTERIVPIGKICKNALEMYLRYSRVMLVRKKQTTALFVTKYGKRARKHVLRNILNKQIQKAGIKKRITLHCLRHSCATHMLQNGAPIEMIQRMLGHQCTSSTQIYTHVMPIDLRTALKEARPNLYN